MAHSSRARARALGLWMNGTFLGTWSLGVQGPDRLQYDDGWLRSEYARPLSLSLPFLPGNAPHCGHQVRAYFENLLPDSKPIRERLARRYRTAGMSATNKSVRFWSK